jgi:hypothetical protein
MAAQLVYTFDYIAPNAGSGLFIHGYSNRHAVNYSAVVYALSGEAYYPGGHMNLAQGETFRHVDGTVARKVYVQNLAPFNPCAIDILHIVETF